MPLLQHTDRSHFNSLPNLWGSSKEIRSLSRAPDALCRPMRHRVPVRFWGIVRLEGWTPLIEYALADVMGQGADSGLRMDMSVRIIEQLKETKVVKNQPKSTLELSLSELQHLVLVQRAKHERLTTVHLES